MSRSPLRNIFDLQARCDVEGKHWMWPGVTVMGRPQVVVCGVCARGARITALLLGRDGEREKGQAWYMECGELLCLSPRCLRLGTHQQAIANAAKHGHLAKNAGNIAAITAARRRRPDVRPAWMVEWARESPQTAAEAAHALGVHPSTVTIWRRAKKRQDQIAGPFAALLRMAA